MGVLRPPKQSEGGWEYGSEGHSITFHLQVFVRHWRIKFEIQ
jgi:hypothetical protein